MKKLTAAASVVLALAAGSAFAADLPSRKAAPVYAPPPPPFSWTGLYGGINVGYGFGNGDQDQGGLSYLGAGGAPAGTPLPGGAAWGLQNNIQGVLGGGQVGYNYQFNPWLVIGFEADIQAADLHSQTNGGAVDAPVAPWGPHSAFVNSTKSVDWFGTARGRLGVTLPSMPNLMVYGTGGLAYGQVNQSFGVSDVFSGGIVSGPGAQYDDTKVGWTAGGGLEWFPLISSPVFSAFSVKVEYLYTDLGSTTLSGISLNSFPAGGPVFGFSHTSETRFHTVRAGLNWHFNPFVSAPVVAKY